MSLFGAGKEDAKQGIILYDCMQECYNLLSLGVQLGSGMDGVWQR